jgi:hypothetical protein
MFIIGCTEAIHTEKYYKEHHEERILKLKECENLSSINAAQKEECRNAFRANRRHIEILDSTKYNYKY